MRQRTQLTSKKDQLQRLSHPRLSTFTSAPSTKTKVLQATTRITPSRRRKFGWRDGWRTLSARIAVSQNLAMRSLYDRDKHQTNLLASCRSSCRFQRACYKVVRKARGENDIQCDLLLNLRNVAGMLVQKVQDPQIAAAGGDTTSRGAHIPAFRPADQPRVTTARTSDTRPTSGIWTC